MIVASEYDQKSNKDKNCILLNLADKQAIEVFSTFSFEELEVDKPQVLVDKFEAYCIIQNEI